MSTQTETVRSRDRGNELADIVRDLGELVRAHIAQLNEKIDRLEERVLDLEGHAEHGRDGECGMCVPETVGADEYGTSDVAISDFTGECESNDPACDGKIFLGEEIVKTACGWRHRDCN
jgi:hypothetical protein